jgi:hypothetical protein
MGGAMYLWSTQLTGRNNIIWGNTQYCGDQIYLRTNANAVITYSDVEGGFEGEGNMDTEPLFNDTLCILQEDSPCIDLGNPDAMYNDPEDMENQGFAKWPAQGTLRNDMGAYGGPRCMETGLSPVGIPEASSQPGMHFHMSCYPNPFTENFTIEYTLTEDAFVDLAIFDLTGQPVVSLVRKYHRSGSYTLAHIDLTGQLFAGIYILRIAAGNQRSAFKLFKEPSL